MSDFATQYRNPEAVVTTRWLADHLNDARLRIFECTMYLIAPDERSPYTVRSGLEDYRQAHIPGAAYLDLQADLSDQASPFRFTMPSLDDLAQRFARAGVDTGTRVILYARGTPQWATRVWWMLRAVGFDNAAVLDGGWEAWEADAYPVQQGEINHPGGHFEARPRPGLFVGRDAVQAAMREPGSVVINALSATLHAGDSARYGRPGRIPGSVNVPATSLRQTVDGRLIGLPEAAERFRQAGVTPDRRAVIYCGGGIAATLDAFVLHQLGADDIAIYDNSLSEWSNDPALPMETD